MPPRRTQAALAALLALVTHPLAAAAAIGDISADRVVGQPSATSDLPNARGLNSSGLSHPQAVTFDAAGNLFVVDAGNARVLGYRSPMTTDLVADVVIGQPDFNSDIQNNGGVSAKSLSVAYGLAVSAAGDLYVADSSNNRVLKYDRPFATDTVADRVFGQPDFTSNTDNYNGLGPASLSYPTSVAIDSAGNLWVADGANNRVLEYDSAATSDRIADRVLGQPDFTTNTPNTGGVSATSLQAPFAVAVDSKGNVWVSDTNNHRVLQYDAPLSLDETADMVLGQPSFTSNTPNYTGQVSAAGLYYPHGLAVDVNGNVTVTDNFNHRVVAYTAPLVTADRIADRVFGQPDFNSGTSNNNGVSATSLYRPFGVAFDPTGNLAIADYKNHRVVLMETPTPIVTSIVVKVSPTTRNVKLVVRGFGMASGSAVIEVDGTPLSTTKYKELAADGSARRVVASDPSFDALVPRGVPVSVTIFNPATGGRSAPIAFTR